MTRGCGHCGFAGELEHKGNVVAKTETDFLESYGDIEVEQIWSLARCPNCEQPTLETYTWVDPIMDPEDDVPVKRLFPTIRDTEPLPPEVVKHYDAALRVKLIDPSFYAVGVRRMLEAVCRQEGAAGKNLVSQIKSLVSQGRLPDVFGQMADQLRVLGNWGAHAADVEVTADDVPLIEDFAEAILEYLYRAPGKVAAVEAALQARATKAQV